MEGKIGFKNRYTILCKDKDGNFKWQEDIYNIVPTVGLNYIIDSMFRLGLSAPSLYAGLMGATSVTAALDTMTSHAGWTENESYSESARGLFVFSAASSGSTGSSGNMILLTINATTTVGGIFVCLGSSVKGGTDGVIMGESAFTSDKDLISGDQIFITASFTVTSL